MSDGPAQPIVEARAGRGVGTDPRQSAKLVEEPVAEHFARLVPYDELRALLLRDVLLGRPGEAASGICWLLIPKADPIVAAAAAAAIGEDALLLVKPGARHGPFDALSARWPDYVLERTATQPLVISALGEKSDQKEIAISRIQALLTDRPKSLCSIFILVNKDWADDLPPGPSIGAQEPGMLVASALCELRPIDVDDFEDARLAVDLVNKWEDQQKNRPSLLGDLIAPGFARVTRRYWDWKDDGKPGEDSLLGNDDLEIDPRPTIACFLVAYFADLNPADFSELSAQLMVASPLRRGSLYEAEPSRVVTDTNLKDAGIAFGRKADRRPYAEFIGSKDLNAQRKARATRAAFRDKAPLLRERMVGALRDALVFGHETASVANDFIEIELLLLQESSRDPAFVARRVRRILLGSAVRAGAIPDVHASRLRAVERAPELLSLVAKQIGLSPAVLLSNLANQRFIDRDQTDIVPPWFIAYLGWAFWGKQRLALGDFPAWSDEGFTEDAADAQRGAYLMWLRNALSLGTPHTDATGENTPAKTGDAPEAGNEGTGDLDEDWSSSRLACEAATLLIDGSAVPDHFAARIFALGLLGVLRPLHQKSWAEAAAGLPESLNPEVLLRAALSKPFSTWLSGKDQTTDYHWSAWDLFAAVDWMLEALFAKSALGVYESSMMQHWLADNVAGTAQDLQFTDARVWRSNRGDPGAQMPEEVQSFVSRIVALLPIVPALLALSTNDAPLPEALRVWLTQREEDEAETPLDKLLKQVRAVDRLQGEWSAFLSKWNIPLSRQQRTRADLLLRDRREAVARADRALRGVRAP
ncbi:MAG: hypothetical protein WCL10_19135 [Novosphingobium sp.]|jgi:hypothetical protein|uniref:hypothetical protein n=1 Tax=Novosphingobium sp. TaxID=1874826 RepID=UPI0030174D15